MSDICYYYKPTVSNVQATAHMAAHPDGQYVKRVDFDELKRELAEARGLLLDVVEEDDEGVENLDSAMTAELRDRLDDFLAREVKP